MIQIDAYDISSTALPEFFEKFSAGIFAVPDYAAAMKEQQFHPSVEFKLNLVSTMPANQSLHCTRA